MKQENSFKNILNLAGVIIGVMMIIFSFVTLSFDYSPSIYTESLDSDAYSEHNSTYGGDAYTGIQNAAAQTANNVKALNENIETFNGNVARISKQIAKGIETECSLYSTLGFFVLFSAGLLVTLKYLGKMDIKFNKKVATETVNTTDPTIFTEPYSDATVPQTMPQPAPPIQPEQVQPQTTEVQPTDGNATVGAPITPIIY